MLISRVPELAKDRGIENPYRFWLKTGLSQPTAYRLFNGEAIPSPSSIDKICQAFRVQPSDVIQVVPDKVEEDPNRVQLGLPLIEVLGEILDAEER